MKSFETNFFCNYPCLPNCGISSSGCFTRQKPFITFRISIKIEPPINNNPRSVVTANSDKLYWLKATSAGFVTGLGITLKVMSGDRIDIFGKSYYFENNANTVNYSTPILDILGGLLGTPTGATIFKGASPNQLNGIPGICSAVQSFLSHPNRNDGGVSKKPRAYINWILFDENFKVIKINFDRVGEVNVVKSHSLSNVDITRNGFLYVYVNNESPVNNLSQCAKHCGDVL